MNRRKAYILNRYTLADSGEYVCDVGIRDVITAMTIEFRATNGASGNKANPLAACITAIELIDGSKVLYSITGKQAFALTAYHRGFVPYELLSEVPSNVQNLLAELQFGRWHGDTQFALDPSKFTNLQLRFKFNLAAVRAVAATAFATGTLTVTVIADVMTGAPNPIGMLTCKQYYSFTTAASGVTYVDLPTDQLIKAVLLQSALDGYAGLAGLSNVKLTADMDKWVGFDMRSSDVVRLMTTLNAPFVLKHQVYAKDADTYYCPLKQEESVQFTPEAGDCVVAYLNYGIGSGALNITQGGIALGAEKMLDAKVSGWCPWNAVMLDQGEYDDPSTYLDPTQYNKLRLELTNSVVSASAAVVLEQVYPF